MHDDELSGPPRRGRPGERRLAGRERCAEFDAFYAASAREVIAAVYAVTGDLVEAQDCAQEAFTRAWERWDRVVDHPRPDAWVRLTARRIAVSRWRRARRAAAALIRHGAPGHHEPPDGDDVALTLLERLPMAQRQAIVLHHVLGFSVEEVARETGAPAGTVKARLSRGRVALARLMAESGSPSTPAGRTPAPLTMEVPR